MCDVLCKVVNLVAALGAIVLGLHAFGYDLLGMMGRPEIAQVLMYVFGAAGIASIVMMFVCKQACHHPHEHHERR